MSDTEMRSSPRDTVRPLLRTRQVREFTDEPLTDAELEAIADAGRWSGSSRNEQPWRFIVIRDRDTISAIHDAGLPQTRSLKSATAAIAIVLPAQRERLVSDAYDDGRAAERMLIAANMLMLGGGIAWIRVDVLDAARGILGLPEDHMVRTVLSLGHPTEAAKLPKSKPGKARRPREEAIYPERWPAD
jgi:nitroreductase